MHIDPFGLEGEEVDYLPEDNQNRTPIYIKTVPFYGSRSAGPTGGGGGGGGGIAGSTVSSSDRHILYKNLHDALDRINEDIKEFNGIADATLALLNSFTNEEVATLVKAGKLTGYVGRFTIATDSVLFVYSASSGGEWGWHAYNIAIGAVGMAGPMGTLAATTIDGYVQGAMYFMNMVYWINTVGEQYMINQIAKGMVVPH